MAQQDLAPAAAGGKNALQITAQYAVNWFNFIELMHTGSVIAEIDTAFITAGHISTYEAV